MQTTAEVRPAGVSISDVERIELATLVRRLVSDSELRSLFAVDARVAIDHAGVSLSAATIDQVVEQSGELTAATANVDHATAAAFFFIIIIRQ